MEGGNEYIDDPEWEGDKRMTKKTMLPQHRKWISISILRRVAVLSESYALSAAIVMQVRRLFNVARE
jgi:hypothetical protein